MNCPFCGKYAHSIEGVIKITIGAETEERRSTGYVHGDSVCTDAGTFYAAHAQELVWAMAATA